MKAELAKACINGLCFKSGPKDAGVVNFVDLLHDFRAVADDFFEVLSLVHSLLLLGRRQFFYLKNIAVKRTLEPLRQSMLINKLIPKLVLVILASKLQIPLVRSLHNVGPNLLKLY